MDGEHHDLVHDLPEHRETIHRLKTTDAHFAKLFEEYHHLDREVRRAESRQEPTSDEHEEELKRRRAELKDELFAMITKAESA
ncbi:MAG: DUF465 domain-containing protein [Azospirillaceae bacterium]